MDTGWTALRARISPLTSISLVLFLLACPVASWGDDPPGDGGAGPRSDDWITINKDYSSQRYVDLDGITPSNVDKLKEVCEIQLNEPVYFNSGIVKVDRTLYVATLRGTYAFDAVTCDLRWRHVIHFTRVYGSNSNRGVGYLDGKIFRGTADGRVIALDASTGQPVSTWPEGGVEAADPTKHEAFVSAPIAWQGNVFIGIGVGDNGVAGRLMAFDSNIGKILWSFQTTVGPADQPPPKAGGGLWATYSLDPKTGEVFAGIANPYPDLSRDTDAPGSTAFTNSVISVDAATGRLNWYYQAVPLDEHDWDLAAAPTLYRTRGKPDENDGADSGGRNMLAITGKSGGVYGIDRTARVPVFETPGTTVENDDVPLTDNWTYCVPACKAARCSRGRPMTLGPGRSMSG